MSDDIERIERIYAELTSFDDEIIELAAQQVVELRAEVATARHALLDARLEVTALRAENARLREAAA